MKSHGCSIARLRKDPTDTRPRDLTCYGVLSQPGWQLHFRILAVLPDRTHYLWKYVFESVFIIVLGTLQQAVNSYNPPAMISLYATCKLKCDLRDGDDSFPILPMNRALPFAQVTPGKNSYARVCANCKTTDGDRWLFMPGKEPFDADGYRCNNCYQLDSRGLVRTADHEARRVLIHAMSDEAVPKKCHICPKEPEDTLKGWAGRSHWYYSKDSNGNLAWICQTCYQSKKDGKPSHCAGGCGLTLNGRGRLGKARVLERKYFGLWLCVGCYDRKLRETGCSVCGTTTGNYMFSTRGSNPICGACKMKKIRQEKAREEILMEV